MSEMSYLEKLLDGVEVEWKTLEDISIKISSGGTPKTGVSEFYDGDIPWLRTQEVNFCDIWDTEVKITESGVKNSSAKWIPKNCVIVAMYGATVGKIGINKIPMTTNQACANIQLNEEVAHYRYVFHFLCSQYTYIKSLGTGSQTNINAQIVKNIKIPIPCPENPEKSLAIQSEIVRILDKFTALTAELTAELTMRKKQYNYYRDQLLSFEQGEVEWKMLGDLGENLDSKRKPITSGLREAGSIPYYGASGIVDYVKDYIFDGDFLLISEDGANLLARNTPIAFSISGKSWVNNHAHVIKFDSYAERRYVEYYLNSIDLAPYISGAAQPKLNKKNLESIRIPNPSPEDKERIVSILDKFDALTNSINEGLPREIELRQKQYEYYRDLLFSFPRPETASN
ncbi:restriction endonuclease subunit S [Escherichia coli]|uniref:restriction endonuclease subunit S n=1 Tax=Escherichia coli TaxID=562 RepID=UPI0019D07937|nr:restriction endonuclease subunit S [Escherichia coli]MBN6348999.1 restriction endonuclease subunit S [Escherichia coli]